MRPLIKIYNSPSYILMTPLSQPQLSSLKKSLIPSLEFVGLQSDSKSITQLLEASKTLKIKDPIVGFKGTYEKQNNKINAPQYIKMQNLQILEIQVPVLIQYQDKQFDSKSLEAALYSSEQNIQIIVDDKLINSREELTKGLKLSKNIKFIIPPISLSDASNDRFYGSIPIILVLDRQNITEEMLVDAVLVQLSFSLKIMLKNKLPYRKLQRKGNIVIQDFKSRLVPKVEPKQIKEEQAPKIGNKAQSNLKLLVLFLSVLVFYVSYKMVM